MGDWLHKVGLAVALGIAAVLTIVVIVKSADPQRAEQRR